MTGLLYVLTADHYGVVGDTPRRPVLLGCLALLEPLRPQAPVSDTNRHGRSVAF